MFENERVDPKHVDEGTLHAWLDGALPQSASDAVQAHVTQCAGCCAAAAEARGLIAASTRILSSLDTAPGGVLPQPGIATFPTHEPLRRRGSVRKYTSIAAALAFVALGALVLRRSPVSVQRQTPGTVASPQEKVTSVVPSQIAKPMAPAAIAPAPSPHAIRVADANRATHRKVVPPSVEPAPVNPAPAAVAGSENRAPTPDAGFVLRAPNLAGRTDAAVPAPHAMLRLGEAGSVTGRVTAAETGLPVTNAVVLVAGTTIHASTDSAGFFTVANVPAGMQSVRVHRIGFVAGRADVQVAPEQPVTLAFALPADATIMQSVVTGMGLTGDSDFTKLPPSIVGSRQLSSEFAVEDGNHVRRTVYALGSGEQLTLVELHPREFRTGASPFNAAPALAMRAAPKAESSSHSITWVDTDGTTLVLSGAVSVAELESFKRLIVR